ncbi:MAG TPA: cobalamin-dependent protein, partial [Nitrospira sp.]|nr:cobalamin-dependent protein [Nitrospira sp.]
MSLKCLAVHPGPLMYTKIYLRLEPLGLELVAEAMRQAGHEVRLLDLQVDTHKEYFKVLDEWKPAV